MSVHPVDFWTFGIEKLSPAICHHPDCIISQVLFKIRYRKGQAVFLFFSKQTIHYKYSNISFPSNYMNVYWYFSFWLVTRREMPKKLDILFRQITTFIKVCVVFVFRLQTLMDFTKNLLIKGKCCVNSLINVGKYLFM